MSTSKRTRGSHHARRHTAGALIAEARHEDGALRVRLSGDLDMLGVAALSRAMAELLPVHAPQVTIDLLEVDFIDSAGVRELLHQHALLARRGARLGLSVLDGSQVERSLGLVGMSGAIAYTPQHEVV